MEGALESGRVLGGRYRLGERLGQGGWGSVYAAVQVDLGRPVAIKVLHTSVALSSDGLARFEREARSAAALGHPNIAQVTDFSASSGEPPFLVMELLTGATLGATMRAQQRLAPRRVAWIAYQVLAGLDVAHKAGIVHRDIKPDNVFLVAMPGVEDFVKLLDFGIAKLSGDSAASQHLTSTGTMLGSPAFMAPEQVRSNEVDHRVDLYALGATMYLALSGRMPFDAPTIHGLLLAITEQRAAPLSALEPSFDPALSAVVERAMHKDPNGRYANAAEMRAALEPWLGGMAAHASSTTNAPRMISPASIATGAIPPPATVAGGPPGTTAMPSMSGPPLGTSPPGTAALPPMGATPAAAVSPYAPSPHAAFGAPPSPAYGSSPAPYGAPTPAPYGAPTPAPYGAPTPAPYGAPTPAYPVAQAMAPAPAKSSGAIAGLLIVVVLLLVVVVGGGAAFFLSRDSATTPVAAGPSGAVAPAAPGAATAIASAAIVAAAGAPANGASGVGGPGGAGGAVARKPGTPGVAAAGAAGGVAGASGAAGAPGAGATGATGGAAGAAGPVAILTDAGGAGGVPAPKKQFAGSSFRVGGGTFGEFDIDASRAAINAKGGAINVCYAATEFDAPDHQFTNWTFQVDPAGNVKSVGRTTSSDPHPKFDACMIGALRQVKWPVSKAGGSPQVSFTSRTRDNP